MKIPCERCGAVFEAADDQDLCAACRDAAAIGDPYRATPAVLGGGESAAGEGGEVIAGPAPPVTVDHVALFRAALRLLRRRPALLLGHGLVSYLALAPLADILFGFARTAGATRADLSFMALIALLTLGLACAVQAISCAVAFVRLDRPAGDAGARRPISRDLGFVLSLRAGEVARAFARRMLFGAVWLCASLSGPLLLAASGRATFWWFVALASESPRVTNRLLNGAASVPLPRALSFSRTRIDRKNVAGIVGLGLGYLLAVALLVACEIFGARLSPVIGWAAIGLLAVPLFGLGAAHAYVTYAELRRHAAE